MRPYLCYIPVFHGNQLGYNNGLCMLQKALQHSAPEPGIPAAAAPPAVPARRSGRSHVNVHAAAAVAAGHAPLPTPAPPPCTATPACSPPAAPAAQHWPPMRLCAVDAGTAASDAMWSARRSAASEETRRATGAAAAGRTRMNAVIQLCGVRLGRPPPDDCHQCRSINC